MPINLDADAGSVKSDRIPDGKYVVDIIKVFTTSQGGGPLKTKTSGDRKIKLVMADSQGREVWYDAIVEGKAVFTIAALLKHAGYSSEELDEAGIGEYTDFLDQRTAERFLLKRRVRINVTTKIGNDGAAHPKVDAIPQEDANGKPQSKPKAATVAPRADVPF